MENFQNKANFIWQVADDILRGAFKQHEYGEVILPFVVLRRLDCVLEDCKDAVIETNKKFKNKKLPDMTGILLQATKTKQYHEALNFYNTSFYDLRRLAQDAQNVEMNFWNYINGYSPNVREIIENFRLDRIVEKLVKNDYLFQLVDKFTEVDLNPDKVSNHQMGYIFEELLRRFSEMSNETAGEHYTPREVIRLMVNLHFAEHTDELKGKGIIRSVYDPACGTGGMLTIAKEHIQQHINSDVEVVMYGQELNEQTYAIAKSDVLIMGEEADNIKPKSSFSEDQFQGRKFDYMLSNPPYGVSWKKEQGFIKNESNNPLGRFTAGLPRISDGALLFLMHMISKMEDRGSRIAIIFNASPLFTGDAGSGESEIRRWIIENDWLEAIVSLPKELFYNTGIPTFIWIVSNKKLNKRKGKVQLINAENIFKRLRRSLGEKKNYITEAQIRQITKLYSDFKETELSRIFDNSDFGFTKVVVEKATYENGKMVVDSQGNPLPYKELREFERVPLKQSIEEYFNINVKPFSPNAWLDQTKNKLGYRIMFKELMYTYSPSHTCEAVIGTISDIEKDIEELLVKEDFQIFAHQKYDTVECDWLKEIPSHWAILPNRALFTERIERGGGSDELLSVTQDRGIVRQVDLGVKQDTSNEDKSNYKRVQKGDLVYNKMRMWQGAVGYSPYEGIVSPAYIVLEPKNNVYSKYFYYQFKHPSYVEQSYKYSYGLCDDMNSLRYEDFRSMLSLVPPYEEQVRITEFIESKIEFLNQFIQKKTSIFGSLLEVVAGKFTVK